MELELGSTVGHAAEALARVERWGNLGVWELDLASNRAYWSTQMFEILGLDELGIDAFYSVVHPDDVPLLDHLARRIVDQPGPYRVTHRIVRGEEVRTVEQHMQSVPDDEGRPVRVLGTMIDVTATRALQQQVHQSQQMRTIGLLAGGLAHDFNNALVVIRGHADVLLDQLEPDDPIRHSVEAISRAGGRASALTRKLMALGRRDELRPARIDTGALLTEVVELVRPSIDPAVRIEIEADDTAHPVLADLDELRQVLIDLVLNARDAGAGRVLLRSGNELVGQDDGRRDGTGIAPGRYGVIEVVDDGSGMDRATMARAFEPFFTTKDAGSGSGLGLANARTVAERSLGALLVSSEVGRGSTMSLLLPAIAEPGTPDRRHDRRRPTRILLAVEARDRSDRLAGLLAALDHQVVCVHDLDAMAFSLQTEPIDAVVLDQSVLGRAAWPAYLEGVATVLLTPEPGPPRGTIREVLAGDDDGMRDALNELI